MPIYVFENETTGEIVEVFQRMKDVHEYERDGVKWRRVFTKPHMSVTTRIDPFSERAFADKTGSSKGTYGDMIERSRELSEMRAAQNGGVDPIKEAHLKEYKQRTGKDHVSTLDGKVIDTPNARIEIDKKPIKVEFA